MLNIILFGLGEKGKIHYKNIMTNTIYNLRYVVDIDNNIETELNKEIEFINFNDKHMLSQIIKNPDINCCLISTPTYTHYELIMLGLNNNKHVFVEQPITTNSQQIQDCFVLAEKKSLKLFVGYNRRFDTKIMNIHQQVTNGDLGFVNYALTISRDRQSNQNSNRFCSGIFHDFATHDIDYMNWILQDKPISVYVDVENDNSTNYYDFKHVMINLKYSKGTIVCINLSRISSSNDQRCELYGEKGEIINSDFKTNVKSTFQQFYYKAFESELQEFYHCIFNKKAIPITIDECLNNNIIANACEESCDKKRKITIKYGNGYRNYKMSTLAVSNNYKNARENQCLEFVLRMKDKFSYLDMKMDIWNILEDLNYLTDVSDPDCSHPNLYHALQTAEMMRKDGLPDWFQLVGLLHDIGKIMYKKGNNSEGTGLNQQWAMVGDTFIVGCPIPNSIIFPEYNKLNPDYSKYSSKLGIYQENCGMDSLHSSWGHDEYLYMILSSNKNKNTLPEEALYIIRWHSLYLYHNKDEYSWFMSSKDKKYLPLVKKFNQYDLYSKTDEIYELEQLKNYYNTLINKYFENSYIYI